MKKNNKKKLGLSLNSGVYPLRIPLLHSKDEIVTNYGLFSGITAGLSEMSCFAQTASFGFSPHTSHQHKGEEIIIVLSGNLNFIYSDKLSPSKTKSISIEKGQFIYFSAEISHTLQAISKENTNLITFLWYSWLKNTTIVPTLKYYDMLDRFEHLDVKNNFYSQLLFEIPTASLKKFNCYISLLPPGASCKPCSNTYDMVIIVLEGEIETIDQKAKPYDVIFYSAGQSYNINNPGTTSARYIVFEFHSNKKILIGKIFNIFDYYFTRLSEKGRLKRKIKKILGFNQKQKKIK